MADCRHWDTIYNGVVNLFNGKWLVGAVDVYKCRSCGALFADEKRYGVLEPPPELGFREAEKGSKWAVFVCSKPEAIHWQLMEARPGAVIPHSCAKGVSSEVKVLNDFVVEPSSDPEGTAQHYLLLVDECVNKGFDVSAKPGEAQ